ncbi:hypothetical protein [Gemmatimonas sp.]|uniref:hypothetical protein n=1 Tax=Gemmatimonas sp. TaxID=1962908 RepID=UPI0031BC33B0|nr:hypothetical protein [Gemmatimonas sp.]
MLAEDGRKAVVRLAQEPVDLVITPGLRVLEKPVRSAELLRMVQELLPAHTVASIVRTD